MLRVGLDIGGTKIAALLVDADLRPVAEVSRPTDAVSPQRLVCAAADAVRDALAIAGASPADLVAAGAGVPGQVDAAAGTVHMAVNLNLNAPFALGPALSDELGVPVSLENDVRAATLGAYHWTRQHAPLRDLAYLSLGTGIAAGVILDGCLRRGAHGMAGEIGHLPLDPNGPLCRCGMSGCFETVAAGPAIAAAAAAAWPQAEPPPTTADVLRLAGDGDTTAAAIVDRFAGFVANGIYLLALAYDVEKVVVGGGVTRAGADFERPLRAALARMRDRAPLAALMLPDDKIDVLPRAFSPGSWGAVMLALPGGPA
jgi:predicted NBD/HSP70 family sugar kinase